MNTLPVVVKVGMTMLAGGMLTAAFGVVALLALGVANGWRWFAVAGCAVALSGAALILGSGIAYLWGVL